MTRRLLTTTTHRPAATGGLYLYHTVYVECCPLSQQSNNGNNNHGTQSNNLHFESTFIAMSLLTTTPTPAKLKAFLGMVKTDILDPAEQQQDASSSSSSSFHLTIATICTLLVRMELAQRGVLINDLSLIVDNNNCDTILPKIWDAVRTTAGKSILTPEQSSNLPPPLLAGSSAIAGRVAELVSKTLQQQQQQQLISSATEDINTSSSYQSAVTRCQEVQENRLGGLLRLLSVTTELVGENSTSEQHKNEETIITAWLQLAQGYYLRAASFQPNVPPMWKKAWDILMEIQHIQQQEQQGQDLNNLPSAGATTSVVQNFHVAQPAEASFPLTHLIRIASSKGNSKRVSELGLPLAESYLGSRLLTIGTTGNATSSSLPSMILQAFVDPYREPPVKETSTSSSGRLANKARQALQQCQLTELETLEDAKDAIFWYTLLQFRVDWTQQEEHIEQEAQSLYKTLQNRGDGTPSTSLESCRGKAYYQVLEVTYQTNKDEGDDDDEISRTTIHATAMALQAALLQQHQAATGVPRPIVSPMLATAMDWIRKYMVRLQDQAKAIALSSQRNTKKKKSTGGITQEDVATAWLRLLEFLYPLLRQTQQDSGWLLQEPSRLNRLGTWLSSQNVPPPEQQVLSHATTLFANAIWMILPLMKRSDGTPSATAVQLVEQLLHMEDMLPFTSNMATCFLYHKEQEKLTWEAQQTTALVQTGVTDLERDMIRLKSARATLSCWTVMVTPSNATTTATRRHLVQEATAMYKAGSSSTKRQLAVLRNAHQAEFGMAYCQCMVAWSGLHAVPWSTCTISEARLLVAKAYEALEQAASEWGRTLDVSSSPSLELILLELANADIIVESGGVGAAVPFFLKNFAGKERSNGGSSNPAAERYRAVLESLHEMSKYAASPCTEEIALLRGHCNFGLARVTSQEFAAKPALDMEHSAELYASQGLQLSFEGQQHMEGSVYSNDMVRNASIWICPTATSGKHSFRYQLSVARQLVADSLIRSGRSDEAESFLEAAVRDAPIDAEAALALGSFLLQHVLYRYRNDGNDSTASPPTEQQIKAAQIQLLKAAKLDSTKANPFALLGVWFESQQDFQRAQGCYSKALALEPPNPVAGRGMLRMTQGLSPDELQQSGQLNLWDSATNTNSPLNGWAWRAIGLHKVMVESQDELAVVALLKALRCRDVERPQQETLGIFYNMPRTPVDIDGVGPASVSLPQNEKADTLAELAMCYHRLGRYTASIRAFYAAIDAAGEHVSSSVLCSCAGVELELGLFDDAANNFLRALEHQEGPTQAIAAYGQGVALLSIAQRDAQDGKAGAARVYLERAIESCLASASEQYGCTRKLLGDLYSFGASLPPSVFQDEKDLGEMMSEKDQLRAQLKFIAKGEEAYRSAVDMQIATDENELSIVRASIISDAGANILLQAQCLSTICHGGSDCAVVGDTPELEDCFNRASREFRLAIETNPLHAPAWCGLGCAVVASDPLLAQHAFSRCVQLDKMFPDSYANIGFLYVSHNASKASESVMDSLTQVADTPMFWINRAFMLERDGAAGAEHDISKAERNISRAADAYRAALQVMKHPSAMLGLSLTCRVVDKEPSPSTGQSLRSSGDLQRKDGFSYMREYMASTGTMNKAASAIGGVMALEKGAASTGTWSKDLFDEGRLLIDAAVTDGNLDDVLNLELIRESLDASKNGSEDQKEDSSNLELLEMSLPRKIVHDPSRPDLWLSLAKQLVKSGASSDSLKPACFAADRSSAMLKRQLARTPNVSDSDVPVVDSRTFSESLSLAYWLRQTDETKEEGEASAYNLQMALIMCPNNPLARQALKNQPVSS